MNEPFMIGILRVVPMVSDILYRVEIGRPTREHQKVRAQTTQNFKLP